MRRGVLVARPLVSWNTDEARTGIVAAVAGGLPKVGPLVVLDMVGFSGPADGLTLSMLLLQEVRARGGCCVVASGDELWMQALCLSQLQQVVESCATVDEAVEAALGAGALRRSRVPRILAMISGGGRSLLNLLEAIDRGEVRGTIVHVVSSGACGGVERARERGLEVEIVPGVLGSDVFGAMVRSRQIDLVALAGYLKLVPMLSGTGCRIVNIHPSLLPKFGGKGMHGRRVHEAVLAAGETESGCTVHFCNKTYDSGGIILQRRCPVYPTDTAETLAARVFEQECLAYPQAVRKVLSSLGFSQP